jgi:hypothetical protein
MIIVRPHNVPGALVFRCDACGEGYAAHPTSPSSNINPWVLQHLDKDHIDKHTDELDRYDLRDPK